MKTKVTMCVLLASIFIFSGDVFAQRYVNNAQEAAEAAKRRLSEKNNRSSSQIEWLNNVVNVINMSEPKKDVAEENNRAIREYKGEQ
jgi:archaellum component FlaF (FlaF/FlaG flagellin family)